MALLKSGEPNIGEAMQASKMGHGLDGQKTVTDYINTKAATCIRVNACTRLGFFGKRLRSRRVHDTSFEGLPKSNLAKKRAVLVRRFGRLS